MCCRIRKSTVSAGGTRAARGVEHLLGHPHAFDHVVVVAPLADVVIQQRQHQQFGFREVGKQRAESAAAWCRRRQQAFDVADGQQRVLVDRVLVVEVADDAAGDRLELGDHLPEQAAVVHLRQAHVEAGPRLEQREQRGALSAVGKKSAGSYPCDVLLDERQRLVGRPACAGRSPPGTATAMSPAPARRAARRRTGCRRASARGSRRPGGGAVRRIHSSVRLTVRAWRK